MRVTKSLGRSRISCGVEPSSPLQRIARHRAGKRLHFRAERHADVRLAGFIHLQINADRVGAFLVFSHIDEIELLALRAAPVSSRCPRTETSVSRRSSSGSDSKRLMILFSLFGYIDESEFTADSVPVIPSEVEESRGATLR